MKQEKDCIVYILTNKFNKVLYTGVTSKGRARIWEHKQDLVEGFTKKYNCHKLVYFESCDNIDQAIAREKQIKSGSRVKKIRLITKQNPDWRDLYDDLD